MDVLRVAYTERYSVLCYGAFARDQLNGEVARLRGIWGRGVFELVDDDWPFAVILIERETASMEGVVTTVLSSFAAIHASGTCAAALCMYDGVFNGFDTMFSPEEACHTYAICLAPGRPVLTLDASVLQGAHWRELVLQGRQRLADANL